MGSKDKRNEKDIQKFDNILNYYFHQGWVLFAKIAAPNHGGGSNQASQLNNLKIQCHKIFTPSQIIFFSQKLFPPVFCFESYSISMIKTIFFSGTTFMRCTFLNYSYFIYYCTVYAFLHILSLKQLRDILTPFCLN